MQLNGFVLRLALLVLPGLLGSKLYRKLRGKTDKETWEDFTEILLFSIISYVAYFIFAMLLAWGLRHLPVALQNFLHPAPPNAPAAAVSVPTTQESELQSFVDDKSPLDGWKIVGATLISVIVAFTASAISTKQFVNRIGFWAGATRRQGDACVWTIFNRNYAPPTQYQWAFIRDAKANLVYFGVIRYFSDPGELHELVLENVTVYKNDSGQRLYEAAVIYVARDAGDLTIEFPSLVNQNQGIVATGANDEQAEQLSAAVDQPAETNSGQLESPGNAT